MNGREDHRRQPGGSAHNHPDGRRGSGWGGVGTVASSGFPPGTGLQMLRGFQTPKLGLIYRADVFISPDGRKDGADGGWTPDKRRQRATLANRCDISHRPPKKGGASAPYPPELLLAIISR